MGSLDLDCIMLGILSVGRLKVNLLALACGIDQAESPAGSPVLPLAMLRQSLGLGTEWGKKWLSRWLPPTSQVSVAPPRMERTKWPILYCLHLGWLAWSWFWICCWGDSAVCCGRRKRQEKDSRGWFEFLKTNQRGLLHLIWIICYFWNSSACSKRILRISSHNLRGCPGLRPKLQFKKHLRIRNLVTEFSVLVFGRQQAMLKVNGNRTGNQESWPTPLFSTAPIPTF